MYTYFIYYTINYENYLYFFFFFKCQISDNRSGRYFLSSLSSIKVEIPRYRKNSAFVHVRLANFTKPAKSTTVLFRGQGLLQQRESVMIENQVVHVASHSY